MFQLQPDSGLPAGLMNGYHQQQIIAPMMNTAPDTSQAQLFIFTPKPISDQFRRAHLYQFGPSFTNQVSDTMVRSAQQGNVRMNSFMYNAPEAAAAITPNMYGNFVNLETFSQLWSFMLLIDIVRNGSVPTFGMGHGMHVPFNTRCIYVGYCSDEPINPVNTGHGPVINPQAMLIITHHTVVNQVPEIDASRHLIRTNTIADIDLIPGHIIPQISPPIQTNMGMDRNRFLMTPGNLQRSTMVDHMNQTAVYTGSEAMIKPTISNTPVSASLNSPRHHMSEVVAGLSNAFVHTAAMDQGHGTVDDTMSSSLLGGDVFMDSIGSFYNQDPIVTRSVSPINPSTPIALNSLHSMFPNMVLTDCRVPATNQWDSVSQEAPTIVNVYGSMLSSTVPAILAGQGLSQIAFRYLSRDMNDNFGLHSGEGVSQLIDIATFMQLSPEQVSLKFQNFMYYMKQTVFPTLLAAGGHFDVTMYCSVAGTSLINLNFLDYPSLSYKNAFYESATSLGGLISPLIGTSPELQHNARELANLITAVKTNS